MLTTDENSKMVAIKVKKDAKVRPNEAAWMSLAWYRMDGIAKLPVIENPTKNRATSTHLKRQATHIDDQGSYIRMGKQQSISISYKDLNSLGSDKMSDEPGPETNKNGIGNKTYIMTAQQNQETQRLRLGWIRFSLN